ncbi:MAG: leucine--tRNA ligase [Deltaproteobacteria bacterium]|nr:leucine--tRNA ligase [Deltaproteobacteria bacterium]
MRSFDFSNFETKWRAIWQTKKQHEVSEHDPRPKYYCLDMFPYPSGSGLHVGHWRGYVLSDVWSRYQTLLGKKVLHPMGWDAFGLPAENDAIKKKNHPKLNTQKNIETIKRQLEDIGAMYDWSREINTTDPTFYHWTQWIFLKMYERGLAYQKEMPINWCPSCLVGLANEEVVEGRCERCEAPVTQKKLKQWVLKITQYAERLLGDLNHLEWPEKVKVMQANWIGKSEGAQIQFQIEDRKGGHHPISIFTTRLDTLFGATFMVLSPEHPLVLEVCASSDLKMVKAYVEQARLKKNSERVFKEQEISGIFLGVYAVHPMHQKKIPVWVSDYVLMDYGTGAIMAVPAHDERDFKFAKKFGLEVIEVVKPPHAEHRTGQAEGHRISHPEGHRPEGSVYEGPGILIHSDGFTGLDSTVAKQKIIEALAQKGIAKATVQYKLRDWIFSRQRYWGEPIPILHCSTCGEVPLREEDLPLLLPEVKTYEPSKTGESPLSTIDSWVNAKCYRCGGKAKRETDTMPQWAGSSWYFLRYASPQDRRVPFDSKAVSHWLPVDMYVGGIEHAVLHLLYARFFTKFLYDIGLISFQEPFVRLFNQGMVCRRSEKTGKVEKMSKSKMNVVNPDDMVRRYGTDTLRLFELFVGPPELDAEWNDNGIIGVHKFLQRAWQWVLFYHEHPVTTCDEAVLKSLHQLIAKVTERLEAFKLNVVVSAFMEFMNEVSRFQKEGKGGDLSALKIFVRLLAPLVPHTAEELWEILGNPTSIFQTSWPVADPAYLHEETLVLVVQVNGRLRANIEVNRKCSKDEIIEQAKCHDQVQKYLVDKKIIKEIYVPHRLINFVVK